MKFFFMAWVIFLAISNWAEARIKEKILVIVNEEMITMSDLEQYRQKLLAGRTFDDLALIGESVNEIVKDPAKLRETLINERLIESEIKKQKLVVSTDQIESEIRRNSRDRRITPSQLKKILADEGMSYAQYQDFIKMSLERRALIQKSVTSQIQITADEIASFYARKKGGPTNTHFYEYTLKQILIVPQKSRPDRAKSTAEKVFSKLKTGESFEELATQFSEDPNYSAGGLIGTFRQDELSPPLIQALRKLEPGQFSEIISTPMGLHILKLIEKKLLSDPISPSEREELYREIEQKKMQERLVPWLKDLRRNSYIRVNL